mgnify:CR=1 FL=1
MYKEPPIKPAAHFLYFYCNFNKKTITINQQVQSVPNTNNLVNMQGVNTNQSMPINSLVTMTMPNQSNDQVMQNQNNGFANNMSNMQTSSMGNVMEPSNFNLANDRVMVQNNMNNHYYHLNCFL